MKRFVAAFASLVFAVSLAAQTPSTLPVHPVGPPKISVEVLKNFYVAESARLRTQKELDIAQKDVQTANTNWTQAVQAMQKVCGDKFQLKQDNVDADPYCAPIPPVVLAPEKK